MAHFTTCGKQYPEGIPLSAFGGTDSMVSAGTMFTQTAPPALPDSTGASRGFLFWDTGRHITGKRTVHWTFNHPENWSEWKAVAWYGVYEPGHDPTVVANAFLIGSGPIDPTPVDGPGSTFVNGPGGTPVAWPYGGDDHKVRTEFGDANIHAKPHVQQSVASPMLDFSSWTWLVAGGDGIGYFDENDDDIAAGGGVTGVANSTSPYFLASKGSGGLLLAGYATPTKAKVDPGLFDRLREALDRISIGKFIDKGDPSPEDIIRLKLISQSLDLVRGDHGVGADTFEGLVSAARKMSAAGRKRMIAETRATLSRGQAALKAIEAMAGKTKGRK